MLRNLGSRVALGAFMALLVRAQAPPKAIDIGAEQAPLSDDERTELARAVSAHDYAAEKAVIDRALNEHPQSRELLIMSGRIAYLEKHAKDAADALERADKAKPLSEDDRTTLALAEQFSGQPEQAHAEVLKLIKEFPRNAQYLYLLGRFDSLNHHMEEAVADLRKAIEIDPNLLRGYQELGHMQENLGLTEDARKTYQTGAARNRAQSARWEWPPVDLGVLLLKGGDLDEAEKLFLESLQYNPHFGWAHYYLGQLNQKRGKNAESMAEYRAAVVSDPALRQAWLALGREYTRLGQQDEADKCLAIFKKLEAQENARKGKTELP